MKRSRAAMASCLCWLLVVAAHGAHGAVHFHASPPRVLQTETKTEAPAQVVANSTETPTATTTATTSSSNTGDDEDRIASTTPPVSSTSEGNVDAAPSPSSGTDIRETEDTSIRRGSGLDIEGIIGIAVGCVAVVALAIAFVHAGSSKRKKQAEQQHNELLTAVQDLASSTMSVKDVKYIESLDSSAGPPGSPRTSTIAAIRKPTVPHTHQQLQGGGSMYTTGGASGSAAPAALVQTSKYPQPTAATIIDVDDEPKPSRVVRTFSRSQRSGSGHDALKKAPLSPESYLKFAQNSFRQSRRSSRHSRAMESPNSNATFASSSSAVSPVPPPQRSRMRFSRRGSLHTTPSNEDDSAADIPMLGGGGGGILARSSNNSSQNDPTSPRDIPVLARGSEESVDSVEDDDVEISI